MIEIVAISYAIIQTGIMSYFGYELYKARKEIENTTKTVNTKVKGLSKAKQKDINDTLDALSKDFSEVIGNIDFNDSQNIEQLDGLPNFTKLLQEKPEKIASASAGFGLLDMLDIISKLSSGGDDANNLLSMLNSKNAGVLAGAGIAYKLLTNLRNANKPKVIQGDELNSPDLKNKLEGRKLPEWTPIG